MRRAARHILFVCGRARCRSPTAEQVFSRHAGLAVACVRRRFHAGLNHARVICLDIPDDDAFMEPALVRLLEAKVPRFLP